MCASNPNGKPNIIYFFPDQLRRQALGFMGEDPVVTPHIDQFAKQSMVFTNACSNFPLCSPYRGMLMTGKYPYQNHLITNCNSAYNKYGVWLREEEQCISDVLATHGYDTGYIGKWHLDAPDGPDVDRWEDGVWDAYTPVGPKRHHFDFWYSYGSMMNFMTPHFWVGDAGKDEKTIVNQWEPEHEVDVAIDYITNREGKHRDSSKPFALFVAPHPPHPPFEVVDPKYREAYEDVVPRDLLKRPNVDFSTGAGPVKQALQSVKDYFAAITGIDEQFGRLMACLKENGLEDNTIVVFSSDHGEMMGSHSRMNKAVWYEESFGIPLLVRWPGRIRPGRESMLIAVPDMMPTLLGLAGMHTSIPSAVMGQDYSQTLLGRSTAKPDSCFYICPDLTRRRAGLRGVRTEQYFYGYWQNANGQEGGHELYDLVHDPYEQNNLAAQRNPALKQELQKQLAAWLEKTHDPWVA